ncbi:MAG: ABC transporter permease [Chloroflexia bacterium]|jgi:peptide/nickel transport system permease protein|nr:ABC transporter permease [Chloroflexia bacterium]
MDSNPNLDVSREGAAALIPKELIAVERKRRSEFSRSWKRFLRFKPGVVALIFLAFMSIVAIVPMAFEPQSFTATNPSMRGEGPSAQHLLGQDQLGRDILSRLIRGTRYAFIVAFAATAISLAIGVPVGAAAGYFGGWVDTILSRIVDTLMAFPTLVLLITLAAVLGPSIQTTVVVIGATVWSTYARVVRADVLSIRERDFVMAARAIGANDRRIISRHVLPNVLGPVIVIASLSVGGIIILEAALSFLGLGITPPTPSWGGMLSDGRSLMRVYPHLAIVPGVAIFITVLAFNLVGDGLRDALDPRQRE